MRTIVRPFAIIVASSFMVSAPVIEARDSATLSSVTRTVSSMSGVNTASKTSVSQNQSRQVVGTQVNRQSSRTQTTPPSATGNATRPGASTTTRPSAGNSQNKGQTTGVQTPTNNNRPNNGNNTSAPRPGNNSNTANRPNVGPSTAPGGPSASRPGAGAAMRPSTMTPAPRPYRPTPPPTAYTRPVPPTSWKPTTGIPTISGILGITFGTGFNLSLNYLYGAGYNISGYGNNAVYLTDIYMLNYIWPDATLYYSNYGLTYSEFYYSTPYYDLARYNAVRANLIATYGPPVVTTIPAGGGYQTTWFGYNNSYITLTFSAATSMGGGIRYYTTLTYGN